MNAIAAARVLLLPAAVALLVGCASAPAAEVRHTDADPQAPRRDLDVVPRKIDPLLVDALSYPYLVPEPLECTLIASRVAELDAVLGADLDDPKRPTRKDHTGTRLLVSGIKSAIPYFGWVRRLTGADRRQRLMESAYAAGYARRGYLKGLGRQLGCAAPAAPASPPEAISAAGRR